MAEAWKTTTLSPARMRRPASSVSRAAVRRKVRTKVVLDLPVELPGTRVRITTRGLAEFVALRSEVGRAVRRR